MNNIAMPNTISSLDLESVKYKMMKELGWSLERLDETEMQYKGFLSLSALFPDTPHIPTHDIDEMWHYHILDTRKYMADCQRVFGFYLHHYPFMGLMGDDDKARAESLFADTRRGFDALGIKLAGLDASDCGGGCSSSSCSSSSCSSGSDGGHGGDHGGGHGDTGGSDGPSSIWPWIATCGSSTPASDDKNRREAPKPANDRREEPRKRSWWERLRLGLSPESAGAPDQSARPDRAALLALAAETGDKRTLN